MQISCTVVIGPGSGTLIFLLRSCKTSLPFILELAICRSPLSLIAELDRPMANAKAVSGSGLLRSGEMADLSLGQS